MINKRPILHLLSACTIAMVFSSCSIYQQHFDCPPPEGIPCASVTEIESMIVETDKGPDIILIPEIEEDKGCFWCKKKDSINSYSKQALKRRVWICKQQTQDEGYLEKGHYLTQTEPYSRPYTQCTEYKNYVIEAEDYFYCKCGNAAHTQKSIGQE